MNAPSRRYLSVWLRRLSTDRIERRAGLPGDAPLIVIEPVKSALRVSALNDAAARLNLQTGMPLADVRAMHPGIGVQTAQPAADRALLEAVADWCDRYTPLVALDAPDGLLLDVSGCAHLFGGEAALMADMAARLFRQGLHARVAVADTAGCAWAVARYGNPLLVDKGETLAALQALPLSALRVDDASVIALAQSGLKRIGDVIERPRAPLAARFGAQFLRRLDQALGREEEAITPRLPVPSFTTERRFADPIGLEADVLGTIERLAQELSAAMERRGEGARLLQVALFRTDGKVYRFEAKAGTPLRDPPRIRRLFSERFTATDECDPGFGYDMIRLSALTTEQLDPKQVGLAHDDHAAELSHLIDRLSARFGAARVTRLSPRDTHIPEYAEQAVSAQQAQSGEVGTGSPQDCATRKKTSQGSAAVAPVEQDSLAPTRPVRLFARPEEIKVIAEVPDGAPAQFIWRFITHDVVATEGPERIAMEWWRDADGRTLTRDYFRVESRQGMRAWLYRDGLYGREEVRPKWYLHGLFA